MNDHLIPELPSQLKDIITTTYFQYLPTAFISPVESITDTPESKGTDFHKGLRYHLVDNSSSRHYAEAVAGEGSIEYQYLAELKNDNGYTGGINMIFKEEKTKDDIEYNYQQLLRTVHYLRLIKIIPTTNLTPPDIDNDVWKKEMIAIDKENLPEYEAFGCQFKGCDKPIDKQYDKYCNKHIFPEERNV